MTNVIPLEVEKVQQENEQTIYAKNRLWHIAVGLRSFGFDEAELREKLYGKSLAAVIGECKLKGYYDSPDMPIEYIEEVIASVSSMSIQEATALMGTEQLEPKPTLALVESKGAPKIDKEAFYGIAGEYVNLIAPHSEADPVGILVNVLTAFGNIIGNNAYLRYGVGGKNYTRLFSVLVGPSAKARKGTTWTDTKPLFKVAAQKWLQERVKSKGGLSSGEGLIHAVRDPRYEMREETDKKTGQKEMREVLVDEGVEDKRLLIIETEFSAALAASKRDGNTLSESIRNAYDIDKDETWSPIVKNNRDKATGPHISIIGHITTTELKAKMSGIDIANGFANRFMWFLVKRANCFSRARTLSNELQQGINALGSKMAQMIEFASQPRELDYDPVAGKLWDKIYAEFAQKDENPTVDTLTARQDSNMSRLMMIYALLDGSTVIKKEHLLAAYALISYSKRCTEYIFGDSTGDPIADTIYEHLLEAHEPLSRTDISEKVFNKNKSADVIKSALSLLIEQNKVQEFELKGTGSKRKKTVYKAIEGAK